MTVLLPAWLQVGTYSAEVDRYVPTALSTPSGELTGRSGVRRWSDLTLKVVATSPASMQVSVNPGIAFVQGAYAALQGVYTVVNDSLVTLSIDPSTSNPRVDLVVLEVLDQSYSGSSNLAQLRVVKGTPSASPSTPSVTGSYITLAVVNVAANASSISSTAIVDARSYAAALGGMISAQDETAMNALPTQVSGQLCYVISTGRIYKKLADIGWEYVAGGTSPTVAISCAGGWYYWTQTGGSWEDLRVTRHAGIVHVQGLIGNTQSFGTAALMFTLPSEYRPQRPHLTCAMVSANLMCRVDVNTDGAVTAVPTRQYDANNYWQIDLHFNRANNTIG